MNAVVRSIGQVAVAVAVVLAGSAAGVAEADNKTGDFGSQEWFKRYCEEINGGTYIEDGMGNLECRFPDGRWIECDEVGRDCWYISPPRRKPPKGELGKGGGNVGGGGLVKSQDSSQEVAAIDDGSRDDGREGKQRKHTR